MRKQMNKKKDNFYSSKFAGGNKITHKSVNFLFLFVCLPGAPLFDAFMMFSRALLA